jgi:hypothetical protein
MAVINTTGVVSQFTTSALMGLGATTQNPNGRFYIDGSMVNVDLSRVIAEAIYIQNIFREGQSVTGKYTTGGERGGAVRVMLETPLPFGSRSLSFGGRGGTDGNAGVINRNAPLLPANDEFLVYLNQVNDQMMLFPDLSKQMIPLDVMASKIAQYAGRVSMDRSASTLAEIIAYAFFRSLNDGENIINEPAAGMTEENAYANIINNANSKMDNGDAIRGAFTYPTQGRTIIGRPSFINGIFNRNSGVILLGGDQAQEMLKNYDLNVRMSDRDYVGTGYKGYAMNFHFQSAPDYIWTLAEAYLGLAKGALANVDAIAVSFDATAVATNVDLGVKLVDATEVRGTLAQPLNLWGHEAFRKSFVIAKDGFTNDTVTGLGFTETVRKYPIAPKDAETFLANGMGVEKIVVPVYAANGVDVVGYRQVAGVASPNGDNVQTGVATETTAG